MEKISQKIGDVGAEVASQASAVRWVMWVVESEVMECAQGVCHRGKPRGVPRRWGGKSRPDVVGAWVRLLTLPVKTD